MKHLLVTNDFPPKIGGIQSYLWELWRRLPPEDVTVLTTPWKGAEEFDRSQPFRVIRTRQRWLLPTRPLVNQINALIEEIDPAIVLLDPALPLGYLGKRLHRPYLVIVHGAEFVIPRALPGLRRAISKVVGNAAGVIASGDYVAGAVQSVPAGSSKPIVALPPGVDCSRFRPLSPQERLEARQEFGVAADAPLVVGVSRLVPRKGFDRLVRAAAMLRNEHPDLRVLIGGRGRDHKRLERLIDRLDAPVTLLGRVPDERLPALYGTADVFAMPCHDRWFGLEREGFGIVFVEAAATAVPSVAGMSGGSAEAVLDGVTGLVVGGRVHAGDVASALERILGDEKLRQAMGTAARSRATEHFEYDTMATQLEEFLVRVGSTSSKH